MECKKKRLQLRTSRPRCPRKRGSAGVTDLIGSIVNGRAGDVKCSNHEKTGRKKEPDPTDYETFSGNKAKSFFSRHPSAICQTSAPGLRDLSARRRLANPPYHLLHLCIIEDTLLPKTHPIF